MIVEENGETTARASTWAEIFGRRNRPIWTAISVGALASALLPLGLAWRLDIPIRDPVTGYVLGVPLGHLLFAILTPAGALATLVFKLSERMSKEREMAQKDDENLSLRRGIDRDGINQALGDFHQWALMTLDPNHTRVAWRMIVSLAGTAPEVAGQAVELAWERVIALLREGCPLGCEDKTFHIHDIGPWILAAPVDSLQSLLALPDISRMPRRLDISGDLIPVRLPEAFEFQMGPGHRLDLSRLIAVAGRELRLRVAGAPGARVDLPQVPLGATLHVEVSGSVHLVGVSVEGTVEFAPWANDPAGTVDYVILDVAGVGKEGQLNLRSLGCRGAWEIRAGTVRGRCLVGLEAGAASRLSLLASLDRDEGGSLAVQGSVCEGSAVTLDVTELGGDATEDTAALVVESLRVDDASSVVIDHQLSAAGAAYGGIVVKGSGCFTSHVRFPPGLASGEVTVSRIELDSAGSSNHPCFELVFTGTETFGGESVRVRELDLKGGHIVVRGPGSAPDAGMPIPGVVAVDGKGHGTLQVSATRPGVPTEGSTGPVTQVRFVGELDDLLIDSRSTAVSLERVAR